MQDIQTLNVIAVAHLPVAFLFRQSPVSIVSWYADCRICFRFFTTGSPAGFMSCSTTVRTAVNYRRTHVRGFRHFPLFGTNENSKLTITNPVLSSYPLDIAVQSCQIAFRQLTAFLPCYVPVLAFAFRLSRLSPVLSYGVVPFFLLLTTPYLGARRTVRRCRSRRSSRPHGRHPFSYSHRWRQGRHRRKCRGCRWTPHRNARSW